MPEPMQREAADIASRFIPPLPPFVRDALMLDLPLRTSGSEQPSQDDADTLIGGSAARLGLRLANSRGAAGPALEALRLATTTQAALTLRLEAAAREIASAGAKAMLPLLITKGAGLARSHPLLADRSFADVDVLVPPGELPRALNLLAALGYREYNPDPVPRRDFRAQNEHAVWLAGTNRIRVDLHHAIPPRFWGRRMPFQLLSEQSTLLAELGAYIPSVEHSAAIAALHVVHNAGRCMRPWRDAAAFLWDPERAEGVVDEAIRLGIATPIHVVVEALRAWLEPPPEATARLAQAVRQHDLRRLRLILWGVRLGGHHSRYALGLPGRDATRFLVQYLWPDRPFLKQRFPGRRTSTARLAWWRDTFGRISGSHPEGLHDPADRLPF